MRRAVGSFELETAVNKACTKAMFEVERIDREHGICLRLAAPSNAELLEALVAAFSLFLMCLKVFCDAFHIDTEEIDALGSDGNSIFDTGERPAGPIT